MSPRQPQVSINVSDMPNSRHRQRNRNNNDMGQNQVRHQTSPSYIPWLRNRNIMYSVDHERRSNIPSNGAWWRTDSGTTPSRPVINNSNQVSTVGPYELKSTLGRGNFSVVKLAQHKITNHLVAIKIVKMSELSEENRNKIKREIDILKKLGEHNHIVKLYQVINTHRYSMLVTECYADGELYSYLIKNGKQSEPQSYNYFVQILSAIEYLHEHNVIHRDLKAENMMLTNGYKTIKLVDFGFANYFEKDQLLNTWCGSPPYAAPELFKGVKYVGPPVDIWSMGVILYVLVCGSFPFGGHNLLNLKLRVMTGRFRIPYFMSNECELLIRGMLRLNPKLRLGLKLIRNHCWMTECGAPKRVTENKHGDTVLTKVVSSKSPVNMKSSPNVANIKGLDKSACSNRGFSLDMEDSDNKTSNPTKGDSSMLCLTSDSEDKSSARMVLSDKEAEINAFVANEIANAVSSMSLDSNNFSLSISQSLGANTSSNVISTVSTLGESRDSEVRMDADYPTDAKITKENSFDDIIIDYMVDNLKIASGLSIRDSIAKDKYDDLHAIYRLLKDEPHHAIKMATAIKFKIPPLPPTNSEENSRANCRSVEHKRASDMEIQRLLDIHSSPNTVFPPAQMGPINLVTHLPISDKLLELNVPPLLCFTPPCDAKRNETASGNDSIHLEADHMVAESSIEDRPSEQVCIHADNYFTARCSFDSVMRQTPAATNDGPPSDNRLPLMSGQANRCLWDSSMLDKLGVLDNPQPEVPKNTILTLNTDDQTENLSFQIHSLAEGTEQKIVDITGTATNLQQIGTQSGSQAAVHPDLFLSWLNYFIPSSTVTQSSVFEQYGNVDSKVQPSAPIEFTPNNLVNQNYNAMNNLATEDPINSPCIPNRNLLDPNKLVPSSERRASDGEASYNSLMTFKPGNIETLHTATTISQEFVSPQVNEPTGVDSTVSPSAYHFTNQPASYASQNMNTILNSNFSRSTPNPIHVLNDDQRLSENMALFSQCTSQTSNHDEPVQVNPLNLTKNSKDDFRYQAKSNDFTTETNPLELSTDSRTGQRHSTTSASLAVQQPCTSSKTSPVLYCSRKRSRNRTPFCKVSPARTNLSGGVPSVDTKKLHLLKCDSNLDKHQFAVNYHKSGRSRRHSVPYPAKSQIWPTRKFNLTFSCKNLKEHNNQRSRLSKSKPSATDNLLKATDAQQSYIERKPV